MSALIDVIMPVFLVIGAGYLAAWRRLFPESAVNGLMLYAQNFAVPVLLFSAISTLDLGDFRAPLLLSYYTGSFASFALGFAGARLVFARSPEDSIAIGFVALFPNSLLLGLPITERAYGADALTANYAIISIHAPLLYTFGIVLMEAARSRGAGLGPALFRQVAGSIFSNPLVIGILLGFAVNLSGLALPGALNSAVDTIAASALPAALFGLGGVLVRYRPAGDIKAIAWVGGISLMVHPAITYALGRWGLALDEAQLRSAVLTAAMAPGINTFLFANMFGAARRVAASAVLLGTAGSIFTIWIWLAVLP